jgi:hypothetical protein
VSIKFVMKKYLRRLEDVEAGSLVGIVLIQVGIVHLHRRVCQDLDNTGN